VRLKNLQLELTQRRLLGNFGSRQSGLPLERVGSKGNAQPSRNDTPCTLQFLRKVYDECGERSVQVANQPVEKWTRRFRQFSRPG
jgi:hypothetical protein